MKLSNPLRDISRTKNLHRDRFTLNDPLVTRITYGDMEEAWHKLASMANRPYVETFVTAIWKQSRWMPEEQTLLAFLEATIHLAAPDCLLGLEEAPASET